MSESKRPKTAEQIIEVLASDLTYIPNNEQRRTKSAFWSRFMDNPICDPSQITLAIALKFVSHSALERWWKQPGFQDWFKNKEEFRERIEHLVHLGMDALEQILMSDDPKSASAKVNAVKLLMEIGRKMPPKQQAEKFLDQSIASMGKQELEEYIKKSAPVLIPTKG